MESPKNQGRHAAREAVLRAFYLSESRGITAFQALTELERGREERELGEYVRNEISSTSIDSTEDGEFSEALEANLDHNTKDYAVKLTKVISESKDELNNLITPHLRKWVLSRVARIDRIILWIALSEMKYMLDVPPEVSISEAVELAKDWSSLKNARFVNGVLDAAARSMGLFGGE
jgi:N utilization substance protein B